MSLVGAKVLRKEDPRLLTGTGTFVDDLAPARTVFAEFVMSIEAHGRITWGGGARGVEDRRSARGVHRCRFRRLPGSAAGTAGFRTTGPCSQHRPFRRRAGCDCRRRGPIRSSRRSECCLRRVRAVAGDDIDRGRDRSRRYAAVWASRFQCGHRRAHAGGSERESNGAISELAAHREPALCGGADRAGCGACRLETRRLDRLGDDSGTPSPAQQLGDMARCSPDHLPGDCSGRRRGIRLENCLVPGDVRCTRPVQAARPTGEVRADTIRGDGADGGGPRSGP